MKIVLVSDDSPFMMNAVARNLQEAGCDAVHIPAQLERVALHARGADCVALFLSAEILDNAELMAYLDGLRFGQGKRLYAVGTAEELERCGRIFSRGAVTATFPRPLDVRNFVAAASASGARKETRILLVDDDGDYLRLLSGWLSKKYRVTMVNSGMQAISYLANHHPDLILLDYAMPVTSGPQVLEMIRGEPGTREIPVIFLTGKDDRESVMEVLSLKPNGYILKTTGREQLLERIEEYVAQGQQEET